EHLITLDGHTSISRIAIGYERAPDRVRVQDRPSVAPIDDLQMERRLGRRPTPPPAHRLAPFVTLQNIRGDERPSRAAPRRAGEPKRAAGRDRAEVPARSRYPATVVKPTAYFRKLVRRCREALGSHWPRRIVLAPVRPRTKNQPTSAILPRCLGLSAATSTGFLAWPSTISSSCS